MVICECRQQATDLRERLVFRGRVDDCQTELVAASGADKRVDLAVLYESKCISRRQEGECRAGVEQVCRARLERKAKQLQGKAEMRGGAGD